MPSRSDSALLYDWALFLFGLATGLRSLRRSPCAALKRALVPVEYTRCAETRYVLQHLNVRRVHAMLDIGSPKLLSLFLAVRLGAWVHATGLVDYFFADYDAHARRWPGLDRERYRMVTQDARALSCSSKSFDRVFSIPLSRVVLTEIRENQPASKKTARMTLRRRVA